LTDKQRQAVECVVMNSMSYRAAGEALGVSAPALHERVKRGLRRLHESAGACLTV